MDIELRDFQTEDMAYLWEVYVNALKHYIEELWGWDQSWQEHRFEKRLKGYQTKLIYFNGTTVGYTQIEILDNSLDIPMLILEPQYQPRGIGSAVLNILQHKEPHKPLTLNCFKTNKRAYRFYLYCNFNVTKTDDRFIYMQRLKRQPKENQF